VKHAAAFLVFWITPWWMWQLLVGGSRHPDEADDYDLGATATAFVVAAPLRVLRTVHSGVIGDDVMWL